jgi:hypothetical protein
MTTAAPSTALVTIQPVFTDAERLAVAGFLAGYRGLTREASQSKREPPNWRWCRQWAYRF